MEFESNVDELLRIAQEKNVDDAIRMLKKIVPEYNPHNDAYQAILEKGSRGGD